jgi:hypothetical protein
MFNFLFKQSRFCKNKQALLFYCSGYIDQFENDGNFYLSCKEDLLEDIAKEIDSSKEEISLWTERSIDFTEIAIRMICTHSYDLLAFGKYHLHGHINYASPARRMKQVHERALQWGFEHGYVSKEDMEEDALALEEDISFPF